MKAKRLLLAGGLILAMSSTAIAQARPMIAHGATATTVELHETALGMVLTSSEGFTLFEFTKDKKNKDKCQVISGCTTVWPALMTSGMPIAGSGVTQSKLGAIKLSGGGEQATYGGRPLYLYTGDKSPGETSYVGAKEFGGSWYAMNAKGKAVKPKKSSGW
jgi:predicted lipoprotein with Yx(FWY)xxD motif